MLSYLEICVNEFCRACREKYKPCFLIAYKNNDDKFIVYNYHDFCIKILINEFGFYSYNQFYEFYNEMDQLDYIKIVTVENRRKIYLGDN